MARNLGEERVTFGAGLWDCSPALPVWRDAEVLASTLLWHPPGAGEPLTIDLASLFAPVDG